MDCCFFRSINEGNELNSQVSSVNMFYWVPSSIYENLGSHPFDAMHLFGL